MTERETKTTVKRRRWRAFCKRNTRGFTLIEVIIVVWMIAVFCFLSSFSLFELRRGYLLKLTGWGIVVRIRQVKMEALQSGKESRVVFDISQNRILFRGKSGKSEVFCLPPDIVLYNTNFPSHTLFFSPAGTPSCGGTVTLKAGKIRRYIIITPVTGRVRFSEKPPL
ncbi:MAG: pilus assembly FimT family protein [Candidatus Caldatribacteriaceae bacterium]